MKYNQYAYVETSPEKATEELLAINFLPENYSSLSFSELLAVLTGNWRNLPWTTKLTWPPFFWTRRLPSRPASSLMLPCSF